MYEPNYTAGMELMALFSSWTERCFDFRDVMAALNVAQATALACIGEEEFERCFKFHTGEKWKKLLREKTIGIRNTLKERESRQKIKGND